MNEKQHSEFMYIVQQCEDGQFSSINVASKIRRAAIVAASIELVELRTCIEELKAERERWTTVVYNERHISTRLALLQDQYQAERALRIAAEQAHDQIAKLQMRELLYDAVTLFECNNECNNPSTAAWTWLQNTQAALDGD